MATLANTGFQYSLADRTTPPAQEIRWGAAASIVLHIVLAIVLAFQPAAHAPMPQPERSVTVEILTPEQFDSATKPAVVPEIVKPSLTTQPPDQPGAIEPPSKEPDAQAGAMITARQLFSSDVLAESGSKQLRETLPRLAKDDRITQLCNIEAVEQIRNWRDAFQPNYLVADAMAEANLHQLTLDVLGGAFRSKRHWYSIQYKCEVARDLSRVASFAFLVGKEIPKREWKRHFLTADDATAD